MLDVPNPSDTIAALSTPPGQGGIGIVRISGPRSLEIAGRIFRPNHPIPEWQSHRLLLGILVDPSTGEALDEVLLSVMKAPRSYTREDVVEINSHSGYALLERILQIVIEAGARPAQPGEFTLRAFLNGRIDLTQAEAVLDLIRSKSERGLAMAARQLRGLLKDRIEAMCRSLIELLAQTEVAIDYPEEEGGIRPGPEAAFRLKRDVIAPLDDIRSSHVQRRLWMEGTKVAIVGRVNAGKSSILNRLSGEDRAIVAAEPGTTRDVVEQAIHIGGLPVRLLDTAGYREAASEVERMGIRLMERCIEEADFALCVVDQSRRPECDDLTVFERCRGIPALVVVNKVDLPPQWSEAELSEVSGGLPRIRVSALTGEGIDALERALGEAILSEKHAGKGGDFAPNPRQCRALNTASGHLHQAAIHLENDAPLDIIALDLRSGLEALGEITGEYTPEDVLNQIFSDFCLGK